MNPSQRRFEEVIRCLALLDSRTSHRDAERAKLLLEKNPHFLNRKLRSSYCTRCVVSLVLLDLYADKITSEVVPWRRINLQNMQKKNYSSWKHASFCGYSSQYSAKSVGSGNFSGYDQIPERPGCELHVQNKRSNVQNCKYCWGWPIWGVSRSKMFVLSRETKEEYKDFEKVLTIRYSMI